MAANKVVTVLFKRIWSTVIGSCYGC